MRFDPLIVRQLIADHAITILPATPFLLDALSHGITKERHPHRLRQVYSAGSTLPLRVFHALYRRISEPRWPLSW
jgi:acyl-coenzyme A synthetase/AMP-(fatty) acid ligase